MNFVFLIFFIVLFIVFFIKFLKSFLAKRFIVKCFEGGSTVTCGMKRRGKDMLFNYVVNKRRKQYISNCCYTRDRSKFIPFVPTEQFSLGGNTFINFVENKLIPYDYPYPDGVDYYISDAGVYFPSQEFSLLSKRYPNFPLFQAICAQLGGCNIHWNVQNFNRLWDKAREQCDFYFFMLSTKVSKIFHIAKVKLRYYDKAQSCQDRVTPMRKRFGKSAKIEYEKFTASYGVIKEFTIYFHVPYRYDDRIFKTKLSSEVIDNEIK